MKNEVQPLIYVFCHAHIKSESVCSSERKPTSRFLDEDSSEIKDEEDDVENKVDILSLFYLVLMSHPHAHWHHWQPQYSRKIGKRKKLNSDCKAKECAARARAIPVVHHPSSMQVCLSYYVTAER